MCGLMAGRSLTAKGHEKLKFPPFTLLSLFHVIRVLTHGLLQRNSLCSYCLQGIPSGYCFTKEQATERMLEALMFHVEKDFHVKDIIRQQNEKSGQGRQVDLRPAGWLSLILQQLTGKKA